MSTLYPFAGYLANPNFVKHMLIPPINFSNKKMLRETIEKHPESILKMAHPDYNLKNPTFKQIYK